MDAGSYYPGYHSIEDVFVTQEKIECSVNTKLCKMGFLDHGNDLEDLNAGRCINLPLWYIKELKVNNPYFTVNIPDIYKNVHKAVCEAETTHIELGKLHLYFYEYGRYLIPYDRNLVIGKIIFETMRQRARNLLDLSKYIGEKFNQLDNRLDDIETKLYDVGIKTDKLYTNWFQMKSNTLAISELVYEHNKKRKRSDLSDEETGGFELPAPKRFTL